MKKQVFTIINFVVGKMPAISYASYDISEEGINNLSDDGVIAIVKDELNDSIKDLWNLFKDSTTIWIEIDPRYSYELVYALFTVLNWYKKYRPNGNIIAPEKTIKYIDTFDTNYGCQQVTFDPVLIADQYKKFEIGGVVNL